MLAILVVTQWRQENRPINASQQHTDIGRVEALFGLERGVLSGTGSSASFFHENAETLLRHGPAIKVLLKEDLSPAVKGEIIQELLRAVPDRVEAVARNSEGLARLMEGLAPQERPAILSALRTCAPSIIGEYCQRAEDINLVIGTAGGEKSLWLGRMLGQAAETKQPLLLDNIHPLHEAMEPLSLPQRETLLKRFLICRDAESAARVLETPDAAFPSLAGVEEAYGIAPGSLDTERRIEKHTGKDGHVWPASSVPHDSELLDALQRNAQPLNTLMEGMAPKDRALILNGLLESGQISTIEQLARHAEALAMLLAEVSPRQKSQITKIFCSKDVCIEPFARNAEALNTLYETTTQGKTDKVHWLIHTLFTDASLACAIAEGAGMLNQLQEGIAPKNRWAMYDIMLSSDARHIIELTHVDPMRGASADAAIDFFEAELDWSREKWMGRMLQTRAAGDSVMARLPEFGRVCEIGGDEKESWMQMLLEEKNAPKVHVMGRGDRPDAVRILLEDQKEAGLQLQDLLSMEPRQLEKKLENVLENAPEIAQRRLQQLLLGPPEPNFKLEIWLVTGGGLQEKQHYEMALSPCDPSRPLNRHMRHLHIGEIKELLHRILVRPVDGEGAASFFFPRVTTNWVQKVERGAAMTDREDVLRIRVNPATTALLSDIQEMLGQPRDIPSPERVASR